MASCASFMESPLVLWVETFANGRSIEFQDLHDGIFLNKVLQQIDSRPVYDNVNDTVDDMNSRLQNWDILIRNIKSFYVDALQQILIVKLPNFQQICKEPEKEASFSEIKKVLLLILGCAIQCDKKENFIDTIKSLDVHVQHEIVELIKEVTDDTEFIMHIEPTEQLETYTEKMFNHVTRLLKERDDYFEILTELAQERDFYQAQIRGNTALPLTTPTSPEKHHMVVELADCKAKIRKLRQELEDKQELISDLQVDQDDNKGIVSKLKNENATLIQDARAARLLRDELDILREKVAQSNSYQTELTKCKEKLNELEFYKSRVNELREDNAILTETKNILEEQLSTSHKRVETVIELENELMRYRQQVEEMTLERDADREKIRILTEDNAQLQFEKKSNMNESTNLEHELESARLKISGIGGTLSDQMAETTNAKVLRLDLENQRLKKKIEELRDSSLIENTSLNLELEKENQRLAKKIEKLQGSSNDSSQQCIDLEQNLHVAARERDNLVQTLETLKDNYERQVRELEAENDNLQQTVHVIRQRNEQTNDTRLKELEKENKQLHETVTAKNQVTSKLEHENRQIQKSFSKLKLNSDHINELETENSQFEKENSELRKNIATLQLICDKSEVLEQENSDLEVENRKLQKSVQTLKSALQKKESLEQENINLTVENKKLERSLHSMKSASSRIAELESEKDSQNREIQQLRKSLENQRNQRTKQEQMELDLLDLDNENQRIQKSLEVTTKRLNQLEKDNTDLEVENEKLQKAMEEMKMSSKRLHNVEKESSELENEVSKLQTSKAVLEKENKRLKQSVQLKDTTVDELTTKCNIMEREHRSVKRTLETQKETSSKLHEFERENREILQQSNINKKTIATLREELVNEKIKSQQLSNELEKLNGELERVGINKEKLVMAEHSQDDNRYKALENMMEEALVKNMEIKEDKILSLQSRLDESKNRNVRLQEELRILKRECESLKQRYEEESVGSERHGTKVTYHGPLGALRNTHISQNNPTKDILDLKDHLVNLERTNATLMTENKNMKSHTDSLNQQIQKLDRHNCQLQSQTVSLQEQNSSFQSQIAKLQVEYSTLQAQCSSLQGQCQLLQNQLNRVESEHQHLIQTHEELQTTHEQLVGDHEDLQRLHEQLSSEHEALISQHGSLKSLHKSLKNENRELTIRLQERNGNSYGMSVQEKEKINADLQSFESLKMEYNHMREKHDIVYNQHEKIRKDYLDLSKEHKQLKTDYNSLRGTCDDYKNQLHEMELELSNLGNKYDSLYQANQKMEDDNKNLLMQVQALLNTNSELLTQILNSKDTIAEEQKSYLERLSDLRRQKERLEEKIMEAYKRQETQKKNKGLGARIARKAAKIFVSKNQRSKSRNNLTDLSADNTSHGSNEITENGDSAKKSEISDDTLNLENGPQFKKDKLRTESLNATRYFNVETVAKSNTTLKLEPRGPYMCAPCIDTASSRNNTPRLDKTSGGPLESHGSRNTTLRVDLTLGGPLGSKGSKNTTPRVDIGRPGRMTPVLVPRGPYTSTPKLVTKSANTSTLKEEIKTLEREHSDNVSVNQGFSGSEESGSTNSVSKPAIEELRIHGSGHTWKEDSTESDSTSSKSTEDLLAAGSPSLLPGLGRPANLGDDEDDDGGFGNRNDNNEMLTLEQFLSESSKTSNHSRGNKSENREDLESKSSENSDNSVNRRRRQAPNPPSDNRISIPDVVSQSQIELNLSRMSRISAGSSGSGYESRPDSLDQSTPPQSKRDHPETSTPAYNNINNIRKFEEAGYSPLVKPDFRKHSLGSTPSTASRTLQYVYPSPYKSPQNRELPPTPNDTPSDRLDRLAGFSQSHNSSNSSSLYSNNQDNSVQYDQSIRSGPTSRYRSGSPVRSNQTFSPVVQQGRPPSSASHHNSSPQTNGQLPPSGPLMRGQSLNRPQTFHESQQNNIYFSIDDNKQNENRPENHYARVQRIERPKSVPPNMFEALQNQENMNNRPKDMHNVSKGTPPKPPPRRSREPPLTTGRVSLLREPGANRSGGRQLPQADTYRSSTPTLRKDTPPRQVPVNEEPPKDPKANSVWR
ncbi:girdin-like isoform X2 [Mytilus californianus]|uniref:girdin-like isoform X2 n=1 Tax=Mytilus californianus TaxID=6549 RepID=UPI0022474F0A|nr:girdin-like isoform X2 [Mytilus californianus]